MRRHPAPRPPGFGERDHLLRVGPRLADRRRCARLPAGRDRRPARRRHGRGRRADRCRRSTARCRAARSARRARRRPPWASASRSIVAFVDRRGDRLQRADLRAPTGRGAQLAPARARAPRRDGTDRTPPSAGPRSPPALAVDNCCADHDGAEPGEAGLAPAQAAACRPSPARAQGADRPHELRERGIEIGFGVEIAGHDRWRSSTRHSLLSAPRRRHAAKLWIARFCRR